MDHYQRTYHSFTITMWTHTRQRRAVARASRPPHSGAPRTGRREGGERANKVGESDRGDTRPGRPRKHRGPCPASRRPPLPGGGDGPPSEKASGRRRGSAKGTATVQRTGTGERRLDFSRPHADRLCGVPVLTPSVDLLPRARAWRRDGEAGLKVASRERDGRDGPTARTGRSVARAPSQGEASPHDQTSRTHHVVHRRPGSLAARPGRP